MEHQSQGNEVVRDVDGTGIVHTCSCGWKSPKCFSNAMASVLGMEHRDNAPKLTEDDARTAAIHT